MKYAAIIEEGRAAWPAVEVPAAAVARQLARMGVDERSVSYAGDRYLAAACLTGSRSALAAFVSGPLKRALGRVRRDLRADVGQAVCERLLTGVRPGLLGYGGTASLERWLRRVAENAAADFARANPGHDGLDRWLTGVLSSPERRIVEALSRAPLQKIVRDVISQLTSAERELLAMFHQQKLKHADIGARLKLPRSTVAHRLLRVHQKIGRLVRERVRAELALATGDLEEALDTLRAEWSNPLSF